MPERTCSTEGCERKHYAKGLCRYCYNRAWVKANPEKWRSYGASYYRTHAEQQRASSRAWAKANPERAREQKRAWSRANPDKARAANRRRYLAHREQKLAQNAAWKKANAEQHKATNDAWYRANRERRKATADAWLEANRERKRTSSAAWSRANRERKNASRRAWAKANPEKLRAGNARYRARRLAARVERYDRAAIFERDGWVCQLCLEPIDASIAPLAPMSAELDHIVPLARGGADAPDNVQAAHRRCNMRKHDASMEDYLARWPRAVSCETDVANPTMEELA